MPPARGMHIPAAAAHRDAQECAPCGTAGPVFWPCGSRHSFQPECMAAIPPDRLRNFTCAKSRILNRRGKTALSRKAPDALSEITIRRTITRHHLAQTRQHGKRIKIVKRIKTWHCRHWKIPGREIARRASAPEGFLKHAVEMGRIADAKCDRIGVHDSHSRPARCSASPQTHCRCSAPARATPCSSIGG